LNPVNAGVLLQANGKFVHSQNKKIRGQRAALPDSMFSAKSRTRFTIDNHRHSGGGDATVDCSVPRL